MIVDVNAVSDGGHQLVPQPAHRHAQRHAPARLGHHGRGAGVPAVHTSAAGLLGVAALTGLPDGRDDHRTTDPRGEDRQLRPGPSAVGARSGRRDHRGERRGRLPLRRPVPQPHARRGRSRSFGAHRRHRPAVGHEPSGVRLLRRQPRRQRLARLGDQLRSARRFQRPDATAATAAHRTDPARTTCCSTRAARRATRTERRAGGPAVDDRRRVVAPAHPGVVADTTFAVAMDGVADRLGLGQRVGAVPAIPGRRSRTSPSPERRSRRATWSSCPRPTSRRPSTHGRRTRSPSVPVRPSSTATARPSRWCGQRDTADAAVHASSIR